ncbi:unnamed protein product [Auanema sp. JU1783]|nr:unnamed protein product [Auanema sp. JU1783]
MAKVFKNFFQLARNDLANQYALPVKSLTGFVLTNHQANKNKALNKALIESLNIQNDDKLLELGYGRGNGLSYALEKIGSGSGMVFGIERSVYMEEYCRKKFILEIAEQEKLRLDQAIDLRNLPYPTDFFDHIYHVDVFYFILQQRLPRICTELLRVLKPGGSLVCGMSLSRLKKFTEWGILDESQWDPMRYMTCLEPAGFVDVKINYSSETVKTPYELVTARKPHADESYYDPIERMRQLEIQIKKDMLIKRMTESGQKPTQEDFELIEKELK